MEQQNPVQIPAAPKPKLPPQELVRSYLQKGRDFLTLTKSRLNSDPQMKRMFMLAGGAIGVIFLLIIVLGLIQRIARRTPGAPTPSSTIQTTVSPQPTIFNPSRYATDSAILSLEESVKGINRDAESLDIREYNLRPPDLDFDINFQAAQ